MIETILTIASVISFVLGFLIMIYNIKNPAIAGIMAALFFCSLIFGMAAYEASPSAMDVYQGKTTLEKIYRNNIPIDSTVIYKPGKH